MGFLIQFNVTVSHKWWWAQDTISLELFGSWLVICINHFVNWTVKIRRSYEKEKCITFGKDFLSVQHWNHYQIMIMLFRISVQMFITLLFSFFHTADWYMFDGRRRAEVWQPIFSCHYSRSGQFQCFLDFILFFKNNFHAIVNLKH